MNRPARNPIHPTPRGDETRPRNLAGTRAFVLAGGAGTRLRSLVNDRPKPMAGVLGRPFLELQLEWLEAQGVREFVVCVGYLGDHILRHFGDGRRLDVSIAYSREAEPRGTGGALKLAERFVDDAFLCLNGDTFVDVDLAAFAAFHAGCRRRDPACAGSLVLVRVPDARDYGSVRLDPAGRIESFEEKTNAAGPGLVSGGIYLLEPELLGRVPRDRKVSLEHETIPEALADGVRFYGFPTEGFFVDIGTPSGYRRFQQHIKQQQEQKRSWSFAARHR